MAPSLHMADAMRDEPRLPEDRADHEDLNEPLPDPVASTLDRSNGEDDDDEGAEPYFPPTDPVITTDERGDAQVLGGFSETSMDDMGGARSAVDGKVGDEALADAVRRELREDASTTGLAVDVEVREGVVIVRGTVSDLTDVDNVEEVAGRVPGVREVMDRTEVADT